MNDVPYGDWAECIEKIFKKNNLNAKTILELGCGTGNISTIFARKNYEVIGIDLSQDMLCVAQEKANKEDLEILYLNQDMTQFELYGTVDAIISVCDSLNYILEEDELLATFKLVKNYLNTGGLFIFDMNTEHKFENILSDNIFAEISENVAYIWDNYYDEEEKLNIYNTNFFVKQETGELYERFEETHYQRAYSANLIKDLLKNAGLEVLQVFEAFTENELKESSERIQFVARKE